MLNRRQADIVVGVVIVVILVLGIYSAMQLSLDGTMEQMGSAPAIHYVGPVLVSLVVASVIGGVYAFVREQAFPTAPATDPPTAVDRASDDDDRTDETDSDAEPGTEAADVPLTDRAPEYQILDVLPEDERRILKPVVDSPGLTQIAVRDRSGFSRSKVSQTITDLEERGLLYRERQGRTYRVYPDDDLDERV